ncbi:MAG TPA: hypothetical protein VFI65_01465 [Streptosporangiaceae bacterium]|nr:hypothetical protein [Streptosporangiaceae bacterium]
MANSIGAIGFSLIVLFAIVVWVLWATAVPIIGVVSGSVAAALGLGWGLVQIISAVSQPAANRWHTSSSIVGLMFGFGLLGLGIGVIAVSVMKSRSGDRLRPTTGSREDHAAEPPTTVRVDA